MVIKQMVNEHGLSLATIAVMIVIFKSLEESVFGGSFGVANRNISHNGSDVKMLEDADILCADEPNESEIRHVLETALIKLEVGKCEGANIGADTIILEHDAICSILTD
jgi:hypothetical protein